MTAGVAGRATESAVRGVAAVESAFDRGKALIAYLVAGHPSIAASRECVAAACESGADLVEVGVPFSDPIADGKVIQAAGEVALKNGMTLRRAIEMVSDLRARLATPMVIMSYCNPILRMGAGGARFIDEARSAGVDGMIVPDMIPDEATEMTATAAERAFAFVPLAAPNARDERLERICRCATGFVYAVGLEGVTGERDRLQDSIGPFLDRLRRAEERVRGSGRRKSIAVGFGISSSNHVRALAPKADGVIVGSAVVRRAAESPEAVGRFIRELKAAC